MLDRHNPDVEWLQVTTIIFSIVAALAAFTGAQAFWIARALDRVYAAIDRVGARLDRIEDVLVEHGERIARLEVHVTS